MNSNIKSLLFKIKQLLKRLLGDKSYKIKGHDLIKKHEKEIGKILDIDSTIVEIGSERKAGSTKYLAKLAHKYKVLFFTVDIDTDTSNSARKIVKNISTKFDAINKPGEMYLKETKEKLGLVYLDAFDIPGEWINQNLIHLYEKRGQNLTLENCWKMHLDCAEAIVGKMKKGGYVCFDDVNPVNKNGDLIFEKVDEKHPTWSGKGETAIPFLLNNGFVIIDNRRAGALLKKIVD